MDAGSSYSVVPRSVSPSVPKNRLPITKALIFLNSAVFAASFLAHVSSPDQLAAWGANWSPATLGGQWWRLLTSMFVHDGLGHVFGNLCALWIAGSIAERVFGKRTFLLLYLITGLVGGVASLAVSPAVLTCGASGAIFGIIGTVLVVLVCGRWPEYVPSLKRRSWFLLVFAAYSLYTGATDGRNINNAAHLAGLAMGLVMGFALRPRESGSLRPALQGRVFVGAAVFLFVGIIAVRAENGWVIPLAPGALALDAGRFDEAARDARLVLVEQPDNVPANILLGDACLGKTDYICAESSLERALRKDSGNSAAEYLLGQVYVRTGRFDDASKIATKLLRDSPGEGQDLFIAALEGKGEFAAAGDFCLSLHRYDEAVTAFKQALQSNPNDLHSKRGLTQAYQSKGINGETDTH